VLWRLDGDSPNRRLIVQWQDVMNANFPGSRLTFQVQVFQSGQVVYAYQKIEGAPGSNGHSAFSPKHANATYEAGAPAAGHSLRLFGPAQFGQTIYLTSDGYTVQLRGPSGTLSSVPANFAIVPPKSQALQITEVMARPLSAPDMEWVEVTNNSPDPIDLNGYALQLTGTNTTPVTINQSLVVPGKGIVLLARRGDAVPGMTPAFVYGNGLDLPNSSGTLLLRFDGKDVSSHAWNFTYFTQSGAATQADAPVAGLTYASTDGTVGTSAPRFEGATCEATTSYGTSGELGTPGAPNSRCFRYAFQNESSVNFEPLAVAGTRLMSATASSLVVPLALPTPIRVGNRPFSQVWVSSNGFVSLASITNPDPTAPGDMAGYASRAKYVAPFWAGAMKGAGQSDSGVYWKRFDPSTGWSGAPATVISWESWGVDAFVQISPTRIPYDGYISFQVWFYDDGTVEYRYGPSTPHRGGGTIVRDYIHGQGVVIWFSDFPGTAANAWMGSNPSISGTNVGFRFNYIP
jgi:hypothetical protein